MKILILTYGYPSQKQPYLHTFVEDEARLLHASGQVELQVVAATPFKPGGLFQKNIFDASRFPVQEVRYFSVPRRKWPAVTAKMLQNRVAPVIRTFRPDLIHAHFMYPAGLIAPLAQRYGIPLVITSHGDDFYTSQPDPVLRTRLGIMLSLSQRIIAVGPKLRNDIARAFPQIEDKLRVIGHSIDFNYFCPGDPDRAQSHLLVPGKVNVLSVARISKVKGLHLLVQAAQQSEALKEKAVFHIVGPVSEADYAERLHKQIQEAGLTEQFKFHGPERREGLRSWYRSCDFYVQPSLSETFGITVLEALACGKPAVVTQSGGPDWIVTPEQGLISAIEVSELRSALEQMLDSFQHYKPEEMHRLLNLRFSEHARLSSLMNCYAEAARS